MSRKNKDKTRQLRLLSQSAMLEEARTPTLIRSTMLMICFCFIAFLVWASQTQIKEMARTVGNIVPTGYVQSIQHLNGGLVDEILVRDDEVVAKGQPLLRLKGDELKSDFRRNQTKIVTFELQLARLRSFISGDASEFEALCREHLEICTAQKGILTGMIEAHAGEKQVLHKQLEQKIKQLELLESELETAEKSLKISEAAFQTQEQLYREQLVSEITFLNVQREMTELQGEIDTLRIRIVQARDAIKEYEWRLQSIDSTTRSQALEEIGRLELEQAEAAELSHKLNQQIDRLAILSPIDGVIKGLTVHTLGGVVSPGKQILEVVPVTSSLFGEVRISPNDIGHVKVGFPVIVKVTSYDFSRYGAIDGVVRGISATTFVDDQGPGQGNAYYKGVIELKKNFLGSKPGENLLLPGMIINADIITGEKSLMSYFLKPIHKALHSAFSER